MSDAPIIHLREGGNTAGWPGADWAATNTAQAPAADVPVAAFLEATTLAVTSGHITVTAATTVGVVICTPGQPPVMTWTAPAGNPAATVFEMALGLRDASTALRNGDDPNETAANFWRGRQARIAEHLARNPWWCETCGSRWATQDEAEYHERTVCQPTAAQAIPLAGTEPLAN